MNLIEKWKETLIARIIPNLPTDGEDSWGKQSGYGYVRNFVKDTINRFEFEFDLRKLINDVFDKVYYNGDTGDWEWKEKDKFRILHPDHLKEFIKEKILGEAEQDERSKIGGPRYKQSAPTQLSEIENRGLHPIVDSGISPSETSLTEDGSPKSEEEGMERLETSALPSSSGAKPKHDKVR